MQDLEVRTRARLLVSAYAPGTWRTHISQLSTLVRYANDTEAPIWSLDTLVNWLMDAYERQGLKRATIESKLQAFLFGAEVFTGAKIPSQDRTHPLYLLRRAVGRLPDDRQPKLAVGRNQLRLMIATAERTWQYSGALQVSAWMVLAHACFLRASETERLRWSDLRFSMWEGSPVELQMTLVVEGRQIFKTHAQSVTFRCEARPQLSALCPVKLLHAWSLVCKGAPPHAAVFPMGQAAARRAVQQLAAATTGCRPHQFGLHSLRAGAATDAEKDGRCLSEIMFKGRWRSSTVLRYLRNGEQLARVLGQQSGAMGVREML